MESNWDAVSIDDIKSPEKYSCVGGPFGSSLSRKHYVESGVPVIRGVNLSGDIFSDSDFVFVSQDKSNELQRNMAFRGDLVFTQRGTLGQVALIPENSKYERYVVSQSQMKLTIDPRQADPYFVYSYFRTNEAKALIENNAIVGGVPHINLGILKAFKLRLPPLPAQKRIAEISSSIDKKITLNRQINQTLEQMAQALFKSWFVDFDPVIDNALEAGFFEQDLAFPDELLRRAEARKAVREHADFKPLPDTTRQLFPAAFEECAEPSLGLGGWVPKGWKYKTAENIAHVSIGKTPPRKESEWFSERKTNNTTWVSIRDMGVFGSHTGRTSEYLTTEAIEKFNVKKVPKGSILLSFKLTLGRVTIASEELTTNEAIAHFIEPEYGINVPYLYCYLINFNYSSLGSTSSIATAVNSKIIKNMPILVPTERILDCYKKQSEPSFQKMKSLDDETAMLTNLRDTLLPKIISGELRLDNIATDLAKEEVA